MLVPPYTTPKALAYAIETVNLLMWTDQAKPYLDQYAKHLLSIYLQMQSEEEVKKRIIQGLTTSV
jgi:hypothetical protein